MQPKIAEKVNQFIQGSVWIWKQVGGQPGGRPVLVISNNAFNQISLTVNCLVITNILKESPVHVPVTLETESHILCEQIHTVSKNELSDYKGNVLPLTLSIVKSKLSVQFDMPADRGLEILTNISNGVNLLNEKAINGFGVSALADEMAGTLAKIHECFYQIKKEIENLQADKQSEESVSSDEEDGDTSAFDEEVYEEDESVIDETDADKKFGRGVFSIGDIAFMIDPANSIDDIIKKFGIKDKPTAYRMRSYYKRRSKAHGNIEPSVIRSERKKTGKPKQKPYGKRRIYTEEDKQFIMDTTNPVSRIMERFGYDDKATVYKMRAYFKKKSE